MKMSQWIKVEDALPIIDGQDCWVWSDDWSDDAEPEMDTWEGNRGEPAQWANGPEEDRDFIRSGWYTYTAMNITHWMPIERIERPAKEQSDEK